MNKIKKSIQFKIHRFREAWAIGCLAFSHTWRLSEHFGHFNWHLGYAANKEDLWEVWNELHKAHKKYAKKLNEKNNVKWYDPGEDMTKKQFLKN